MGIKHVNVDTCDAVVEIIISEGFQVTDDGYTKTVDREKVVASPVMMPGGWAIEYRDVKPNYELNNEE